MNLLRLAAQIFLIYLLYKLVVNIIIPIYRSTKQIKTQFREMQDHMQNAANQKQAPPNNQANTSSTDPEKEGDYIEFEEVKE